MNNINVKAAAAGVRVPREDNARRYIEQDAVTVPHSAYYQRQIAAGDLVVVDNAGAEAAPVPQETAKAEVKRGKS